MLVSSCYMLFVVQLGEARERSLPFVTMPVRREDIGSERLIIDLVAAAERSKTLQETKLKISLSYPMALEMTRLKGKSSCTQTVGLNS